MEMMPGITPGLIEPVFGITPKAFNAIDVVSSLGLRRAPLFLDDDMISFNREPGVGMPVVAIV